VSFDTDGRPLYPDDTSATPVWEQECDRSQGWAVEARAQARRRARRQLLWGVLFVGLALLFCIAVIAAIVYVIVKAI